MISLQARPKKKQAYPSLKLHDDVYIAGFGIINKYEDETGVVSRLLDLMDGTRTVAEIAETMVTEYPEYTQQDVIEAISDFDQDRFIENTVYAGADTLDPYALQRYHRNINFFSTYSTLDQNKYEIQKKLIDAKVCLLGLGGLGSHIAYDLAGLGIGEIRAVEFDTVDLSNLNRQILYNHDDIGKKKATLATERIKQFNPSIQFKVVEKQLASAEEVMEVIDGCQYVILVADRPKTWLARWVNEACVRKGVTLLAAGLEAQRGMHYTVVPGVTGCVECWMKQVEKHDPVSHAFLEERRRLNLTGDNTAIVPLVSIVTGLVNAELLRLITGIAPSTASGRLISIDFDTMHTAVREEWERDEDCPLCR